MSQQSHSSFTLSDTLQAEFERNAFNPCVGKVLLSEDDKTRVWYMRVVPGERVGFHRHVLDYFWTALSSGKAQQHVNGAAPTVAQYVPGQTKHLTFGPGEFMVHDLENIGETDLVFVTVEHKNSANKPLPLPHGVAPRQLQPGD